MAFIAPIANPYRPFDSSLSNCRHSRKAALWRTEIMNLTNEVLQSLEGETSIQNSKQL
jgi:hypothetical protein